MSDVSNPGKWGETVVPSDVTNLSSPCRSIYVGVSGNISAVMYGDGATVVFANVPVGIFPIQATRINATGTTATTMVALR